MEDNVNCNCKLYVWLKEIINTMKAKKTYIAVMTVKVHYDQCCNLLF